MFKKVLQSISKSLNRQPDAPPHLPPAPGKKESAPPAAAPVPASQPSSPASAGKQAPPAAPARPPAPRTPEEMLGIEPKMTKDQIRDHLKLLYRRYNRAASSLDSGTRAEADSMLTAIVTVREKHFGQI